MKLEEIKELVEFILGKDVGEFELEVEGLRIRLVKPKPEIKNYGVYEKSHPGSSFSF